MFNNLQEFITALDRAGELKTVDEPVSAHLEISKYIDRESKSPDGGKALLFRNVIGSAFPAAANLFGGPRRIRMALGVTHLDQLGERVKEYMDFTPPRSLREVLHAIPLALNLTKFFPRSSRATPAPCQETVLKGADVDLSILPALHCWPGDAGPFITLPLVFTKSLETGKRNVGMYRMQIFDRRTTGMHWHVHKDGSHYFNEYRRAGKPMPAAVAIGADPATIYAATAPMPRGVDEMLLAGFLRKKPVRMTRCLTIDMEVPAEAEFVLEGYVNPGETRREGPFGDHTGYYSLADDYPVFHVTAITHRKAPVYNTTLVGRPPMEDCYLAQATERLFLPMLQTIMPEIRDYWFPWEGVFHNIAIVSIDKEYPGHAQKIMHGLWGQGQMSFCKTIVVVDKEIDPQSPRQVLRELAAHLDLASDITIARGILDVLDHSSPFPNFGAKLGVDLTVRLPGEPPRGPKKALPPPSFHGPEDLLRTASDGAPWITACKTPEPAPGEGAPGEGAPGEGAPGEGAPGEDAPGEDAPGINRVLFLSVERTEGRGGKEMAHAILQRTDLGSFNIFILFDRDVDLSDASRLLWKLFNNVDPGRDLIIREGRTVIDAGAKGPMDGHERDWPDELAF